MNEQVVVTDLRAHGVPELYRDARLEDFPASIQAKVEAAMPHKGLFIGGGPGRGKTHLAIAVLRTWIEHGVAQRRNPEYVGNFVETSAMFIPVSELLAAVRSRFNASDGERADGVTLRFKRTRVLVMDDFGSEHESSWSVATIYEVLAHRINHCLPTIVTSNLSLPEIHKIDPRMASRLGGGLVLLLDGDDRRLEKAAP